MSSFPPLKKVILGGPSISPPPPKIRNLGLVYREEDEEVEELLKPLEWGLIRRLFNYAAPEKRKLRALIIMSVVRAAQLPGLVYLSAWIIKSPIKDGNTHLVWLGVIAYAALAITTDGLFHFRQRYALEIGETVVNGLRAEIFSRVQRQPMSFFHRVKLGRIIGRMTSDVESLRLGIQDVLFVTVIQFGTMFFCAVAMAWSDWPLFLVVAGMAPILWVLNRRFRGKFSYYSRAASESFSRVTATLAESVNGIRVTQGFVREQTNAGLFRSLLSDHSRYNIALARTSAILTPLLELNSQFFVAILLMFGGWRVFHHRMEVTELITFFLLANPFFAPLAIIGNQFNQAQVAMAGAERVFRLIDTKPDWEDDPNAWDLPNPRHNLGPSFKARISDLDGEKSDATVQVLPEIEHRSEISDSQAMSPPAIGARVEFRQLSFGYDPARPVLHEVSFIAEPGQTVALVGHTGSGKSSIINLVSKFYLPTAGELFIDGQEIRSITSDSLHHQMGMVQQQNFLFSGTVLDNIRLSKPEATEAEVRAAAAQLDCLDIFDALPGGLHAEVGERGSSLSVGQRQLICFARALIADPRIVILDEATSSIDALTEARLQVALITLLRGRTSFVVAHRLSTIRHADLVLVLDQGRVIERGTHTELLFQGGHYASLYQQFVQVDERT